MWRFPMYFPPFPWHRVFPEFVASTTRRLSTQTWRFPTVTCDHPIHLLLNDKIPRISAHPQRRRMIHLPSSHHRSLLLWLFLPLQRCCRTQLSSARHVCSRYLGTSLSPALTPPPPHPPPVGQGLWTHICSALSLSIMSCLRWGPPSVQHLLPLCWLWPLMSRIHGQGSPP